MELQSQADFLYLLEVLFIPVLDWNPFSDTSRARVIGDSSVFDTIRVYIPSENLHTYVKITLESVWFRMVLIQIIT